MPTQSHSTVIKKIVSNYLENHLLWMKYTSDYCDSPIEEIMFAHLMTGLDIIGHGCRVDIVEPEDYSMSDRNPLGFNEYYLIPQLPIGKYKVDFALVWSNGRCVIECDGHDFHEKTKSQAAHDKRRDRELVGSGWPVFRFTGSEIYGQETYKLLKPIDDMITSSYVKKAVA